MASVGFGLNPCESACIRGRFAFVLEILSKQILATDGHGCTRIKRKTLPETQRPGDSRSLGPSSWPQSVLVLIRVNPRASVADSRLSWKFSANKYWPRMDTDAHG